MSRMRVLSVHEEYIRKIMDGSKREEYRTWRIAPGPLALCSTAKSGKPGRVMCVVDVGEARDAGMRDGRDRRILAHPLTNVRPAREVPREGMRPRSYGQIWYLDVEVVNG